MSRSSFRLKLNTNQKYNQKYLNRAYIKIRIFLCWNATTRKKIPLQVNTFYKQIHHTIIIQPYSVSFKSHSWDQEKKSNFKMGKKITERIPNQAKQIPFGKEFFFCCCFILLLKSRFMVLTTDAKKQLWCELYTYSQLKLNYL